MRLSRLTALVAGFLFCMVAAAPDASAQCVRHGFRYICSRGFYDWRTHRYIPGRCGLRYVCTEYLH